MEAIAGDIGLVKIAQTTKGAQLAQRPPQDYTIDTIEVTRLQSLLLNQSLSGDDLALSANKEVTRKLYVKSLQNESGYNVNSNYNQLIYPNAVFTNLTQGFTFENYKAEIDAGRPVLLHVGNYTFNGIGYSNPDIVYVYNTLDHDLHTMTWGGTFNDNPHYGISVIELETSLPSSSVPFPAVLSSPATNSIVSGTSIEFHWNASVGATKYFLHVNSNPNWGYATRKFYGNVGNTTTFTDSGYFDDGKTYYWKIWAGNDAGWSQVSTAQNSINGSGVLSKPPTTTLATPRTIIGIFPTSTCAIETSALVGTKPN